MKKLIMALSIFTVSQTYASDGLVTVKQNGTYTVGTKANIVPKVQIDAKIFPTPSSGFRVVK